MSRIGKQPITIPEKTTVKVEGGAVVVKGPQGELQRSFLPLVSISVFDSQVILKPTSPTQLAKALWGTYASHVVNMIQGVNTPFEKKLIIEGIGYRAELQGEKLVLSVGFSHPVTVLIPTGIEVKVEKSVINIKGSDKEKVGEFAAVVRAVKKPEPYKGKGIRYENEIVRRKQGKKSVA